MATAALRRPIGHDDRLSLVDHLDELRSRLIICAVAVAVSFGLCAWQNGPLLNFVNRPLDQQTRQEVAKGQGPLGQTYRAQQAVRSVAQQNIAAIRTLSGPGSGLKPAARAALAGEIPQLRRALAALPRTAPGNKPITLGVGEPFTATLRVAFYYSLLFSLPFVLWQLYAFILPAFSAGERRVALPLLALVPTLFVAGVAFGYFFILPKAVGFLLTFNSNHFNVLVQARDYYGFTAMLLLAMGIVFQVPVGILAVTRSGLVKLSTLRRHRRYALVACALIATPLPGTDPISMIAEIVMLYVLYEVGLLLSAVVGRATKVFEGDDEPPGGDLQPL